MQPLIPFLEIHMPAGHRQLYDHLTNRIEQGGFDKNRPGLQVIESNLSIIRSVLAELKSETVNHVFESESEEILFFKITKPHFHSLLIYWSEIFDLELMRPLGGMKAEEKYLRKHLRKMEWFFERHAEFYAYYRSGKTYLDKQFFKIAREANPVSKFTHAFEIDPRYSTEKDWLVAKILAFERLQSYVEEAISKLKSAIPTPSATAKRTNGLQWTASKANLVELIYALHSGGVYNNGNVDIKSIARNFEELFHVELGNVYNVFNELRLKKTSRTQLLDTLKEKVIRKMDELDEK